MKEATSQVVLFEALTVSSNQSNVDWKVVFQEWSRLRECRKNHGSGTGPFPFLGEEQRLLGTPWPSQPGTATISVGGYCSLRRTL